MYRGYPGCLAGPEFDGHGKNVGEVLPSRGRGLDRAMVLEKGVFVHPQPYSLNDAECAAGGFDGNAQYFRLRRVERQVLKIEMKRLDTLGEHFDAEDDFREHDRNQNSSVTALLIQPRVATISIFGAIDWTIF